MTRDGRALVHAAVARDDRVGEQHQRDRAAQLGRLDEQLVEGALGLVAQHASGDVTLRLAKPRAEALAKRLDEKRRVRVRGARRAFTRRRGIGALGRSKPKRAPCRRSRPPREK